MTYTVQCTFIVVGKTQSPSALYFPAELLGRNLLESVKNISNSPVVEFSEEGEI